MKGLKATISLLLVFVFIISVFSCIPSSATTNGITVEQAVSWIKARGNENWWSDEDGAYGCQCVDLAMAYYTYLVGYRVGGHGCDYATNRLPAGWYRDNTPAPGAIISWAAYSYAGNNWYTGEFGHVGLVYAVSGSTVYTVETNCTSTAHSGEYGYANARYCVRNPENVTYIHPDFSPSVSYPDKPTLTVTAGSSTTNTVFKFSDGANTSYNELKVYKSDSDEAYYVNWNISKNGSFSYTLPAGSYKAVAVAINSDLLNTDRWWTFGDYVYFTVKENTYTVSYNANGGKGAPESQTKYESRDLTLSSVVPTRKGYTFLGWATSSTAEKVAYKAGGTYSKNKSATLYAVWDKNVVYGDVNGDNHITLADAMMAFKYVAKTGTLTSTQFSAADCNRDGYVKLADAMAIFNYIAKITRIIEFFT